MSRNIKSRAIKPADALVVCLCLLGAAAFLWVFQADLNQSLRRANEEPIGFIAAASRAALRRFQDRVLWDRLRKEAPVYNGDFIRTAERSGAAVLFPGGELIDVLENSLIRIFMEEGLPRVDFARGNISVYAGETESLVSSGGVRVRAAAGSVVSLSAGTGGEGSFSIQVIEGNVSLSTPEEEWDAEAGTALILNAGGTVREEGLSRETPRRSVLSVPPPEPLSPEAEAAYYYQTESPELRFRWTVSDEVLYYVLEAADNPGMTNPVLRTEARSGSLIYSGLADGRWYWRVTPVFSAAYRGTVPASPVIPFTLSRGDPPPPAQIADATGPSETAGPARTEEAPAAAVPVETPSAAPVRPVELPFAAVPVEAPEETAPVIPPLPAALERKPENGYVVGPEVFLESRTIVFSWEAVAEADTYIFTLFQEIDSGTRQTIISAEGPETFYTLENLSLLELGRFVWRVEAVDRETDGTIERRGIPGENRFTVDISLPDRPRGRDPGVLYGR